jgi:rhodanese-related sulfurtransferase
MKSIIIDVREDDEYSAEHIENSIHIPLSSFDKKAPSVLWNKEAK